MNQTHDPAEAVNDDDGLRLDRRDLQPEMFYCINREHVEFDEFDGNQKCAEKFKKACVHFKMMATRKILFLTPFCKISFSILQKIMRSVKIRQRKF